MFECWIINDGRILNGIITWEPTYFCSSTKTEGIIFVIMIRPYTRFELSWTHIECVLMKFHNSLIVQINANKRKNKAQMHNAFIVNIKFHYGIKINYDHLDFSSVSIIHSGIEAFLCRPSTSSSKQNETAMKLMKSEMRKQERKTKSKNCDAEMKYLFGPGSSNINS